MLAKGGLVESRRGVNGGYVLTRRPEDISAAEIIAALDGPVALTACVDGAVGDCRVESLCPLLGGWDRVHAPLRTALESVSLAALYAPAFFPERAALPGAARPAPRADGRCQWLFLPPPTPKHQKQ